jgi:hypothetical protein
LQRLGADDLQARPRDHHELLLLDGVFDDLRHQLLDGVLDERLAPDHPLDERTWRLPLAETRHVDALDDPLVGLVDGTLQPLILNLDIEDNLALFDLLRGHLHRRSSSSKRLASASGAGARRSQSHGGSSRLLTSSSIPRPGLLSTRQSVRTLPV